MRHLRLPLGLILVGILVYAVLKGLLYWRVKSMLDDWVLQAEPQAQITYQDIATDLGGSARVYGIQIQPRGLSQGFDIEQVRIVSDDVLGMFKGKLFEPGKPPPEQMALSISGVRLPLNADLLALTQPAQAEDARPVCDRGMQIDPNLMQALGFTELQVDMAMQYRFNVPSERLEASMQFELRDIESVSMDMELANLLPEDIAAGRSAAVALVSAALELDVQRAFGDRFMRHCAQQKGQTLEAYRQQLLTSIEQDLTDSGVVLGAGLKQALLQFYQQFGNLTVKLRPEQPVAMPELAGVSPKQMIDTLGLHLLVNGQRIDDLDLQFNVAQLIAKQRQRLGRPALEEEQPLPGALPPPRRVQILRHYESVSVAVLDQYLGAPVRIKPLGQPERKGKLVAIVDGEAVIEQRAHGGSITTYVRLGEIESVQVERIERKPLD